MPTNRHKKALNAIKSLVTVIALIILLTELLAVCGAQGLHL
jgi:hypothetical protein